MNQYSNVFNKKYVQNSQILSSLVINPPYAIDGFTTSPKIAKILSLPFGLRVTSSLLLQLIFKFVSSLSLLTALASILILCLYLPIEKQNNQLISSAKSMSNEKCSLLVSLNETTSYNKLFANAESYSLKDTKQIIHIRSNPVDLKKSSSNLVAFNKYPSIQFSGF